MIALAYLARDFGQDSDVITIVPGSRNGRDSTVSQGFCQRNPLSKGK